MVARRLRNLLAHPLAQGAELDDPETIRTRRELIRRKGFLSKVYEDWYRAVSAQLPPGLEPVLELGSGPGFLGDHVPGVVATDVQWDPNLDLVMDAMDPSLARGSVRGIVMTNVLHHIPDAGRFFESAARVVTPGGVIVMVEPWVTSWSRVVYGFHHEPFDPAAPQWSFPSSGPLSGANGALPWIVFNRDRTRFEKEFPIWRIEIAEPIMPFVYILSGGVSLRSLMPSWSYGWWRAVERILWPFRNQLGMFAFIVLRRAS